MHPVSALVSRPLVGEVGIFVVVHCGWLVDGISVAVVVLIGHGLIIYSRTLMIFSC